MVSCYRGFLIVGVAFLGLFSGRKRVFIVNLRGVG